MNCLVRSIFSKCVSVLPNTRDLCLSYKAQNVLEFAVKYKLRRVQNVF